MRHSITTLAVLALLATPALAGPTKTHDGILLHDPLRVTVVGWGLSTFDASEMEPGVAQVLETTPAGRAVKVYARDGKVVGVQAKTVADAAVLASLGLGAEVVARPRANSRLIVTGRSADGSYLRVRVRGGNRWIASSTLEVGVRHLVGEGVGNVLAPAFGLGTEVRGARFFHPDGHTFQATVEPLTPSDFAETAAGMGGNALIRLGLGWNRLDGDGNAEPMVDILSLAIRFYDAGLEPSAESHAGDQDLLLSAGAKTLAHFPYQMFFSNTDDYLRNDYYPAMPFEVEGREVDVRVVPKSQAYESVGSNRLERLHDAIANGQAVYVLEVKAKPTGWDRLRFRGPSWNQLAEITFQKQVDVDQDALHYHPGMAGRGLQPTGWIAQARGAVYRASQDARSRAGALQTLQSAGE